ncbi:MAG: ROK family protein [Maribacter arcticus]|uniref:ROK family protein n=1 Tax=Maribacter arcticus TaxID=561365 RepID=UPI00300363B0
MDHYLGIEIGGTKIQMVSSDQDLNIVHHSHFLVGEIKDAHFIQQEIEKRIGEHLSRYPTQSIGVGFGGPIHAETGQILTSFQVHGWEGFNLKNWLTEKTGLPTFVDNDANIAALAESTVGSGRPYKTVFYITLGSGVGGGFVLENEIYHGGKVGEFEIGHLRMDKNGTTLEACCSGWALNKKLKQYLESHPKSALAKYAHEDSANASKYLMKAIQNGDTGADRIFQEMIANLAHGLSHLIHLVNPEVICIGGGLSLIGSYLIESIHNVLPNYLMELIKQNAPDIKLAELGALVVPIGAVLHAKNELQKNN